MIELSLEKIVLFDGEPIAHSGLGEQEARARRIRLEFVPQLFHVDAQIMRLVDVGGAPDFAQQMPILSYIMQACDTTRAQALAAPDRPSRKGSYSAARR
jgi:hypothetical protein